MKTTITWIDKHEQNLQATIVDLTTYMETISKLRKAANKESNKFKKAYGKLTPITAGPCRGYSYTEWDSLEAEKAYDEMVNISRRITREIDETRTAIKNLKVAAAYLDHRLPPVND